MIKKSNIRPNIRPLWAHILFAAILALLPFSFVAFANDSAPDESFVDDYVAHSDDMQDNADATQPTGNSTDLPINIAAIGRTVQPGVALSMRFIELDLFSETSQMVNASIEEQLRHSRAMMNETLFESFEAVRTVDVNEQIYTTAQNLGLFAEPMRIRQIGEAGQADEIPPWAIVAVLLPCAVLGYFLAIAVIQRKEDKTDVHNYNN